MTGSFPKSSPVYSSLRLFGVERVQFIYLLSDDPELEASPSAFNGYSRKHESAGS